jgi:hypothetical protein
MDLKVRREAKERFMEGWGEEVARLFLPLHPPTQSQQPP